MVFFQVGGPSYVFQRLKAVGFTQTETGTTSLEECQLDIHPVSAVKQQPWGCQAHGDMLAA